jgi:hypothetical protein
MGAKDVDTQRPIKHIMDGGSAEDTWLVGRSSAGWGPADNTMQLSNCVALQPYYGGFLQRDLSNTKRVLFSEFPTEQGVRCIEQRCMLNCSRMQKPISPTICSLEKPSQEAIVHLIPRKTPP